MMAIEDLLSFPLGMGGYSDHLAMNPLTEIDALQEAQLLDVRIDALRSTVGLLFELRMALELQEANTGVLVAHGVREVTWSAVPRSTSKTAWNVVESVPNPRNGLFHLFLGMLPDAELRLSATSAQFFIGDVEGIGDVPPNYVDDDEATIQAGIAGWRSRFSPVGAVFIRPSTG